MLKRVVANSAHRRGGDHQFGNALRTHFVDCAPIDLDHQRHSERTDHRKHDGDLDGGADEQPYPRP